jgi:hypothetical protein
LQLHPNKVEKLLSRYSALVVGATALKVHVLWSQPNRRTNSSKGVVVMRKILAISLVLCLVTIPLRDTVATAAPQDTYDYEPYTPEQLDNLLAPIALYPDPLLAQVLPAATFVDQVQQAAGWVQSNGTNGIDDQYWDVSVKAVAHYPMVIQMMANRIDWTTSVGQAYVNQSTDVMASVQRLRALARSQGNLYSTPQQQVVYQGGYIQIVPAQPQYIYVPTYDPGVVYVQRHGSGSGLGALIAFGAGLAIGAWLNRDVDWRGRRVYYDGWHGGGWRQRSRPYVQVNNVTYVNNTYQNVTVNRTVVNRNVNVTNINNFRSVHRNVMYNNVVHNNTIVKSNPVSNPNNRPRAINPNSPVQNRNSGATNPNNRRLNAPNQRGMQTPAQPMRPPPPAAAPAYPAQPRPQPPNRQVAPQPRPEGRPARQPYRFPPTVRPGQPPAAVRPLPPASTPGHSAQPRPEARPAPTARPEARPAPQPETRRTPPPGRTAAPRPGPNRVERRDQKPQKPEKQEKPERH